MSMNNFDLTRFMDSLVPSVVPHPRRRVEQGQENLPYKFHVSEFALGSTDGRGLKFYSGVSYPTTEATSFLTFLPKINQFRFSILPLPPNLPNPITSSTTPPFPWPTAPLAAHHLKGEFGISDVLGRGIGCFRDKELVMVTRMMAEPGGAYASGRRDSMSPTRGGRARNTRSPSYFSVDGYSDSEDEEVVYRAATRGGQQRASTRSPSIEYLPSPPQARYQPHRAPTKTFSNIKVTLTISLRRPPRFQVPMTAPDGSLVTLGEINTGGDQRGNREEVALRQGTSRDFVGLQRAGRVEERDAGEIGVEAEQEVFKVSQYLAYRFILLMTPAGHDRLVKLLDQLRILSMNEMVNISTSVKEYAIAPDIVLRAGENAQRRQRTERMPEPLDLEGAVRLRAQHTGQPLTAGGGAGYGDDEEEDIFGQDFPFSTRWLIEGLVSHQKIMSSDRLKLISLLDQHAPVVRVQEDVAVGGTAEERAKARREAEFRSRELREKVLTSLFNEDRIRDLEALIKKRVRILRKAKKRTLHSHVAWIYRAQVTPTRVLLFPPAPEISNHVLRTVQHEERFLRITFTDEEDRVRVNPRVRVMDDMNPAVGTLARVRRTLDGGLRLAGRLYVWLANGNSQARDHGCWLVSETREINAGRIRTQMGDIREKVVAKYAARMGLQFSTTRLVRMQANRKPDLKDIVSAGGGKFTFTDGAGVCSFQVGQMAALALGLNRGYDAHPSAVQIRYGGAKGVLSVQPFITKEDIQLRPSMEKFKSDQKQLNVVRISQWRIAYLNRQFIVLLSALGIPDSTFVDMFDVAIKEVRGLPGRVASGTHSHKDIKTAEGLTTFPIKSLIKAGFAKDAVISEVLKVVECRLLSDLKWRARLPIVGGVYLLGIPDEFGVLKEGEVFCQRGEPDDEGDPSRVSNKTIITRGPCIVTRAPALHPGDIRLVTAVDHASLHHLVNVIVFPVKGKRDLPNMLGGGDLDGDDFTLIWDPAFHFSDNYPPMDYEATPPIEQKNITQTHVKGNFVNYIKNDILGQVDNAHLAWADLEGPLSPECLQLSRIHSVAVDFAKTGRPATLPLELQPKYWPSFMGKEPERSYESDQILGQLFRMVDADPIVTMSTDFQIRQGIDARITSIDVPSKYLIIAARLKINYDMHLWALILRYKVTEAEAVAGVLLKNGKRKKQKDGDLKDAMQEAYRDICTDIADEFDHFATKHPSNSPLTAKQLFAVACYQLTYDRRHAKYLEEENEVFMREGFEVLGEDGEEEEFKPTRMISFAWLLFETILSLPQIRDDRR